jgi:uncharacterized PurR-regulated membrane protein YhhQ (DUF165 family)
VISELVDTEVYSWFVTKVTTRHQWARVLASNAVSVPLDNVIFAVAAFGSLPLLRDHALTLPWDAVWEIFWVNLTVKAIVSGVSLPLIYLSPDPHSATAATSRRRRSSASDSWTDSSSDTSDS